MRPYSRLVLLAAVAAGVRADPESLTIHGQTVRPADHLLANAGEVTVIVTTTTAAAAQAARGAGREVAATSNDRVHIVNVGIQQADAVMTRLERTDGVVAVEFDQPIRLFPGEDDDNQQRLRRLAEDVPYGVPMVLEDEAWWKDKFENSPPTGSSKICVVDTGYQNGHEDLPTLDENSDGFSPYGSSQKWYEDGNSHGTHCAGSIGAVGNNDKGVVGVIPDSLGDKFSFFIGKGLTNSGSGSFSGIISCMQKCKENGANIISMSLGGSSSSTSLRDSVNSHYQNDVLIIAAAGNGANSAYSYPASYESVLSVAAVDSSGNRASFSQYNDQIEIAAPGVSVRSTIPNGYGNKSGTSMAAPHVAGVAGLLRMYFPDCKAFQIRRAMIASSEDKGASGCDMRYGHGIVRAKQAFEFLEAHACDPSETPQEAKGGCAEPINAPVTPTNPPVAPPTSPPVAPPTAPSPTPPPVAGDDPDPGVIEVDLFKMHFKFTPEEACAQPDADISPGGASNQQCAQACASLENCPGFIKPEDGNCVLSSGLSEDDDCDEVTFYRRTGVMHFH